MPIWYFTIVCAIVASATMIPAYDSSHTVADTHTLGRLGKPTSRPAALVGPSMRSDEAAERVLSGLIGSKHDFSNKGEQARDLCTACHTPHAPDAPPSRSGSNGPELQPLRPYQAIGIELDSPSLLCLSCHDGVIAPDVYGTGHSVLPAGQLGRSKADLNYLRSHPIGVKYPIADPKFQPSASVSSDETIKLPGGRIQCTSCHDPHNTRGIPAMLVKSNDRSRLCLSCHRM